MYITILTVGSNGDVAPYIALGCGLQAAGHRVRLATHVNFEGLVRSHGLDFAPIHGNPEEILHRKEWQTWIETGRNPVLFAHRFARLVGPLFEQVLADAWKAAQGTEVLLFSRLGFWAGYHIAEKTGAPSYGAYLQPWNRTRAYPKSMFPGLPSWFRSGSAYYNLMTHMLSEQVSWQLLRPAVNKARRTVLNLPPLPLQGPFGRMEKEHFPILYGFSSAVLPKPAEWGDWVHVTGFWFFDRPSAWQPPAKLVDFLASGQPPVYIGFGSMSDRNTTQLTQLVVNALRESKQRGILAKGWGGLSDTDAAGDIFEVESIPHDWLFPRMAAVVHHGGIGTIGAALRAGIPNISVPFLGDQFFWGKRLADLGVAPKPIPRKGLSVETLAAAIVAAVGHPEISRRAANLAKLIRAEGGVTSAVEFFHRHLPVYS
jgi:sterol 3beta-glucosyltransferase